MQEDNFLIKCNNMYLTKIYLDRKCPGNYFIDEINFSMEIDEDCFYTIEQATSMVDIINKVLGIKCVIEEYKNEEF